MSNCTTAPTPQPQHATAVRQWTNHAPNFDITVKLLILNWSLVSPIAGAPAIIAYAKREMHT